MLCGSRALRGMVALSAGGMALTCAWLYRYLRAIMQQRTWLFFARHINIDMRHQNVRAYTRRRAARGTHLRRCARYAPSRLRIFGWALQEILSWARRTALRVLFLCLWGAASSRWRFRYRMFSITASSRALRQQRTSQVLARWDNITSRITLFWLHLQQPLLLPPEDWRASCLTSACTLMLLGCRYLLASPHTCFLYSALLWDINFLLLHCTCALPTCSLSLSSCLTHSSLSFSTHLLPLSTLLHCLLLSI